MMRRLLQSSVDMIPWRMRDRIRRMPLVKPMQQWLIARFLSGTTFAHTVTAGPAKGVRFPVTLPHDKLIWTGTWELELSTAIQKGVHNGDVCYDIGSYHGFFAGVMAAAGASRVHCFEANPANVRELEILKSLNPQLPLDIQAVAVGANVGEAEFVVMPDSTMGKLASSSFQRDESVSETLRVSLVSLDSMVRSHTLAAPHVIKIDVEGAELDVLRGARQVLQANSVRLFIEAHSPDLARSCGAFLRELGFSVVVLETGGTIEESQLDICHLVASR